MIVLSPKYTKWVHDQSHSVFIIALYTITQNASKNNQTQNNQSEFMKSYEKFENNMDNLQYNFQNFRPVYVT